MNTPTVLVTIIGVILSGGTVALYLALKKAIRENQTGVQRCPRGSCRACDHYRNNPWFEAWLQGIEIEQDIEGEALDPRRHIDIHIDTQTFTQEQQENDQ